MRLNLTQNKKKVFPKKVAQNDVKHILVLELLRSDDFLGVHEKIPFVKYISTGQHTYIHIDTIVSR